MSRGRGALAGLCLLAAAGAARSGAPLTGAPALSSTYDLILDARFDRIPGALAATCPPAPAEACRVLDATALWWRIQLDPDDTQFDEAFDRRVEAAISATESWTSREPSRAEAWFYRGGAYGARVQWRVQRGHRLSAARDGKRIKESLERALELDPSMQDARFGIGLYKYYADLAPAFARIIRFLLLLPGGDKVEGLRDMEAARSRGALLVGEAEWQLHWIYLWYEDQNEKGLALVRGLQSRYAHNPLFRQREAEILDEYFHDSAGSLASWESLLAAARAQRVAVPALAETRARLGAARQLDVRFETDRAVEHLRAALVVPGATADTRARAHVSLGEALDRLGRRDEAVAAYRAALSTGAAGEAGRVEDRARAGLRRTPDARAAEAYRVGLEGWRLVEGGRAEAGADALRRALDLAPDDAVARTRLGVALARLRRPREALEAFDRVLAAGASAPALMRGRAAFESGRLLEAAGDRARAVERYRAAAQLFGADRSLRREAEAAVARLGG